MSCCTVLFGKVSIEYSHEQSALYRYFLMQYTHNPFCSLPLAGLVLADPLLLPEDGRKGKKKMGSEGDGASSRWRTSVLDLISMLKNKPQLNP